MTASTIHPTRTLAHSPKKLRAIFDYVVVRFGIVWPPLIWLRFKTYLRQVDFRFFLSQFFHLCCRTLISVCFLHRNMRAKSKVHVEYEILQHLLDDIDLQDLEQQMVDDKHSKKRFEDGAKEVFRLINNLAQRRIHRLPKTHEDYEVKQWVKVSIVNVISLNGLWLIFIMLFTPNHLAGNGFVLEMSWKVGKNTGSKGGMHESSPSPNWRYYSLRSASGKCRFGNIPNLWGLYAKSMARGIQTKGSASPVEVDRQRSRQTEFIWVQKGRSRTCPNPKKEKDCIERFPIVRKQRSDKQLLPRTVCRM